MFSIIIKFFKNTSIVIFQIIAITSVIYLFFTFSPGFRDVVEHDLELNKSANELENIKPGYIEYSEWYINWFSDFLKGDMGYERKTGLKVSTLLWAAMKITFPLTIFAMLSAILIGLLLLWIKKQFPNNKYARSLRLIMKMVSSTHYIVLAFLLRDKLLLFDLKINIYIVLIMAVGNTVLYEIINLFEVEFDKIFNSTFIKAAKARGGSVFKNSIYPVSIALVRIINAVIPLFIGNAFIIEYIFGLSGFGYVIIDSINAHNYKILLDIVFVLTIFIVSINKLANKTEEILDPRPVKG